MPDSGLFRTPFTPAYWRAALKSFHNIRNLVFAALMIAACIILSSPALSIRLGEGLSVSVSFAARALCSLVYGPVGAVVFAAAEDTLSFLISSRGDPYFPGYLLTTMLGCLWYALFFYRARMSILRVALAKALTNVQNVFLGSLWSAILYSKGYLYYMTSSAVKNLIYLPIQILILVVLFGALLPVLHRLGLIPSQTEGHRLPWI